MGEYTALARETAETLARLAKEAGVSVAEIKRMIMDEHLRINRATLLTESGADKDFRLTVNGATGAATFSIGKVRMEVSAGGDVVAYAPCSVLVEARPAGDAPDKSRAISISDDFNKVVVNGATIERVPDGHLIVTTRGAVAVQPA